VTTGLRGKEAAMTTAAVRAFSLVGGIALLLPLSFLLPLATPVPSRADVAPESALLVHVQPVSPGNEWCQSPPISTCGEVVRSTPQEGPLEFLICFMAGMVGSGDCLQSLHTEVFWPGTWEFVSFEPLLGDESCGWNGEFNGSELDLWWYEDHPMGGFYSVLPVARFVMNVSGPGRFELYGAAEAVLRAGCDGATYVTHPWQKYGEAGIGCGHPGHTCAFRDPEGCVPVFQDPELVLVAPSGGTVDSTTLFSFDLYGCHHEVHTNAPWCAASIETDYPYSRLHVTANAAGLLPATYETAIELYNPYFGVGRCLPVTFVVEETIATSPVSWGRVKTFYR
jgi:hypothetical protein